MTDPARVPEDVPEEAVEAVARAMRPKWFPKDRVARAGTYEDRLQRETIADARIAIAAYLSWQRSKG